MESREHMQATEWEYGGNMHFFIGITLHLQANFVGYNPGPSPHLAAWYTCGLR